jgi:enoyl-CoA hydratase/carnithine racemase
MADVEFTVADHVGTVTLNRPDVKNALSIHAADDLASLLQDAQSDPDVHVLILTGAGNGFCGGGDLNRLAKGGSPSEVRGRLTDHMHRVPYAFEALTKPVIAAVNGDAFGAGMDIALMCDFRFAANSARFSDGYILAGLVPGDGGCFFLPRIVGIANALDLLLTGRTFGAQEALKMGVVHRVCEPADLLDESLAFATSLASRPTELLQTVKRLIYESARSDLRTSLHLAAAEMGVVRSTTESARTFEHFLDNRHRSELYESDGMSDEGL